jgi:pimeloyl-ACP methyl ester carboxylesterase
VLNRSTAPQNSTTVRTSKALRFTRAALQAAYLLSEELGTSFAERLFTSPRRYPRPERERAILARGRRFDIEVPLRSPRWGGQRTRVAAWRWGLGPTVLLVHGWEGRGSQLCSLVEPLVAAGLSVVTFDAPAHGDSAGRRVYLTDQADAVAAVAAAVGPLHATISHSFGGAATLLAYVRDRVDAPRNVMIAPNVLLDEAVNRFARTVRLDDADRPRFEEHLAAATGVPLKELALERLVGGRDAGLLVVHDVGDREVPVVHGQTLATTWPQARLHLTDGLGHRKILRDPTVIAETVEFVRHGVALPASDLVREVDRLLA